ncbi:hypothetical protein GUJ93_ZPchr0013g35816 [Zizania palustris]|uniref:RRM domain-containing protein n=1 Tax=Zizania palustris TaxID=103762 RepID=A0A8J5WWY3_ZIZPA|nr:hypothetical protein GUJ93_ZPchr0013g35816 [Zizania palustris]KAG8096647.1 hypothetical protein GUJ93_ZPchr0013g35816 [Zizania palustris]
MTISKAKGDQLIVEHVGRGKEEGGWDQKAELLIARGPNGGGDGSVDDKERRPSNDLRVDAWELVDRGGEAEAGDNCASQYLPTAANLLLLVAGIPSSFCQPLLAVDVPLPSCFSTTLGMRSCKPSAKEDRFSRSFPTTPVPVYLYTPARAPTGSTKGSAAAADTRDHHRSGSLRRRKMSYSRGSRYESRSYSPSPYSRSIRSRYRSRSRSVDSSDVENPGNNLYVTGLSARVTDRDLEKHFSTEGEVIDASIVLDPWTRESRGFGFVTMATVKEADCCIKYLDRSVLEGRVISVEKILLTAAG